MSLSEDIAAYLLPVPGNPVRRVAVDGVGKTTFADSIAAALAPGGRRAEGDFTDPARPSIMNMADEG